MSPDGRFEAHAYNYERGTWFGREKYVEFRVNELATGREVWHVSHHHLSNADVPEYGARGITFVAWAADSSSVTITVGGGREMTFPVP